MLDVHDENAILHFSKETDIKTMLEQLPLFVPVASN
jgi:hypothetical protein